MTKNNQRESGGVSPELDAMTCDLIGELLDALAVGEDPGVAVALEDAKGNRSVVALSGDGEDECLLAASEHVQKAAALGYPEDKIGRAVRYAYGYLGYVRDDALPAGPEAYRDALLVSFGEKGAPCGYSAYVLVEGIGAGDAFGWADPEPAGEEDLLV